MIIGCDPGISIYQVKSQVDESRQDSKLLISIKPTRQLIGETWYTPEIIATNKAGSSIAVTKIELSTRAKVYAGNPGRDVVYPVTILPGKLETLRVLFRLDDNVRITFRLPVELWVHYHSDGNQGIARVTVVGGSLKDAS